MPYWGSNSSGRQASLPARSSIRVTSPGSQGCANSFSLASAELGEALIIAMTGSMLHSAMARPSKMWPRSRALRNKYTVRRVTTSRRWRINASSISLRFRIFGWPSTRATILIPNTDCMLVCAYKLLSTTSPISPRRSSITTRIPSLSDSSRNSVMPSIFFSFTNSAIRSIRRALFNW